MLSRDRKPFDTEIDPEALCRRKQAHIDGRYLFRKSLLQQHLLKQIGGFDVVKLLLYWLLMALKIKFRKAWRNLCQRSSQV